MCKFVLQKKKKTLLWWCPPTKLLNMCCVHAGGYIVSLIKKEAEKGQVAAGMLHTYMYAWSDNLDQIVRQDSIACHKY